MCDVPRYPPEISHLKQITLPESIPIPNKFYVVTAGQEVRIFFDWNDAALWVTHVSGAIYKGYMMFQDALMHYHKAYYAGELCVMPKPGSPFWKKPQGSLRGMDVGSELDLSDWFFSQVNIHSQ
ncbi:hypothetical protein V8B97DRAFT_1869235 [Scleroderma yunnanense]